MPLKLLAGTSRKMGLPNYGSLGASCSMEVELSESLLGDDLDAFQRQVRTVYAACAEAVNHELTRQQADMSNGQQWKTPCQNSQTAGSPNGNGAGGGSEDGDVPASQPATERQIDFACALARQIRGLGIRRLEGLADALFRRPIAELSSTDASSLIHTLKELRSGKISLEAILECGAS